MNKYQKAKIIVSGALIALIFAFLDQLSKLLAVYFDVAQTHYFLGLIRLNLTYNTGMAFGTFDDNPTAMKIVLALTILMIVGIPFLYYFAFKRSVAGRVALAIVEGGAIGNLIDRLVLNKVRDFLDIAPTGFGNCNVADFCITLGAVALIFIILFIGPTAVFPLKKSWREQAKREEEELAKKKQEKNAKA